MEYEDIINTKYPYPTNHKKMSMISRAAQFSPFAALTGYDEAIKEENRFTNKRIELGEDEILDLDLKLQNLKNIIDKKPFVTITYFVKDLKKDGGSYKEYSGHLIKIDNYKHILELENKIKININDIIKIKY